MNPLPLGTRVIVAQPGRPELETSFLDNHTVLGIWTLSRIAAALQLCRSYVGSGLSVRIADGEQ